MPRRYTKKADTYSLEHLNPELIRAYYAGKDIQREDAKVKLESLAPAYSVLADVLDAFYSHSDIPLILPFVSTLHIIATKLLQCGSVLEVYGQSIRPSLWSIVLSDSGNSKSWAMGAIQRAVKETLGEIKAFTQPGSDRSYLEQLQTNNNALWFQDEFAKFFEKLETQGSPENAMKGFILKTYDHSQISKRTAKYEIIIEKPCLSILGLNTPENFAEAITETALQDGTGQRFQYFYADEDPSRDYHESRYAFYKTEIIEGLIRQGFRKLDGVEFHPRYTIDPEAFKLFESEYTSLMFADLSKSFKKRLSFNTLKLALVYHLVLAKDSTVVDCEDVAWAARNTKRNVRDLSRLLEQYGYSDLEKTIQAVEKFLGKHPDATERQLIQGVWRLRSVSEAKQIRSLIQELHREPTQSPELHGLRLVKPLASQ